MNARTIATQFALLLTVLGGTAATAAGAEETLAWQQPGYVMEVVVVTAPRPTLPAAASAGSELAWQQPGYVQEVVVAKASRSEVLAKAWAGMLAARERIPFLGMPTE